MEKDKKILFAVSGLLAGAFLGTLFLFSGADSAQAKSIACERYEKYRDDYKNSTYRARYQKTKWLKNHDKQTYQFYKNVHNTFKNYSKEEIEKLDQATQDIFTQFSGFKKYKRYLTYKNRCHNDETDYYHQILSFSLSDPGENETIEGTINQAEHTIDLASGNSINLCQNITQLVPTIEISPEATVSPLSGVENDFSSPVTYTVTGKDDVAQDYTVTVNTSGCPN